ncbi:hypothetical protein [Chryseoglobus sp. 28M-23]|uniref:hypothetical protein n=1 Tax=Chryseoglobus sp. 28M-23 TaxID=2772253 RepID=UPI0017461506|nr:hypothetical protein [Chryseoglobus sp. 28M-23]QOD93079.1 hypothetical protein IE160_09040 [Chryseoglobus sp. 28M-23]
MHPALSDPKINAPQWPWLRLLAAAGIVYAVLSVLNRLGRTLSNDGVTAFVYMAGIGAVVILLVVLAFTAHAVRTLRALESTVPPEGPDRMLFPTFGFGTTGIRLMAVDGAQASPRGLWGWKLVEVTPHGVHVHSHPQHQDEARFFAASEIEDAALGAITDGMLRVPTLNLAVDSASGPVGVPLGLLRHPLAVMSGEEREGALARARELLGVPREY